MFDSRICPGVAPAPQQRSFHENTIALLGITEPRKSAVDKLVHLFYDIQRRLRAASASISACFRAAAAALRSVCRFSRAASCISSSSCTAFRKRAFSYVQSANASNAACDNVSSCTQLGDLNLSQTTREGYSNVIENIRAPPLVLRSSPSCEFASPPSHPQARPLPYYPQG